MYCCTQFFHSNFLVPHIPTILYYTYDKCYVAWRNNVNKWQSFIVSQLTLYCTIRIRLSNISCKEHIQYFLVFWGWVVSDSILQLIWVNAIPIFIICIWTWTFNALSDNTHNILYFLDVELTKILRSIERPHPQSAGTTKSQHRVGTRKRPKKKPELAIVR